MLLLKKEYLIIVFLFSVFLIAGCGDSTILSGRIIGFSTGNLDALTHIGGVYTMWDNWDADIEDDGLVLSFIFYDAEDQLITFDGIPVNVNIQLYTLVGEEKGRLVYEANEVIKSNSEVDIFNKGIRIPSERIDVEPEVDEKYGIAEVTIKVKGKEFSARGNFIQLYQ